MAVSLRLRAGLIGYPKRPRLLAEVGQERVKNEPFWRSRGNKKPLPIQTT